MPFTVENRVGRLVEHALAGQVSELEMRNFRTQMWAVVSRVSGRVAMFADMTKLDLLAPGAEEGLVAMIRGANLKIERSAVVWPQSQTPVLLQLVAVMAAAADAAARDGKSVERRGFTDKDEARRWLGEVLDTAERSRLDIVIRAIQQR